MYTFKDHNVSIVSLGISLKSEFFLQKLQNMQNNAPDANENILKKRVYEDLHK